VEGFHAAGARLSPAELGEVMLANRPSPSRALRMSFSDSESSALVVSSSSRMTELQALEGLALLGRVLTSATSCACSCMWMSLA